MKMKFLKNDCGDISFARIILLAFILFISGMAVLSGNYFGFPLCIIVHLPVLAVAFGITLGLTIKSIKEKTLDIFAFSLIPVVLACFIGIELDVAGMRKTKRELLETKTYVEKYYAENGKLPDSEDGFLKNKRINIKDFGDGNFELVTGGAKIKSGEDSVFFFPRP